ncbi:hypothetical protein KC343_g1483 [Hortaea werneckii]|nr:hypothetical protein KC352_g6670 [Hortaea werneckii]KAI7571323.1 hypothetical protein KC317_g1717 [Hortaea werneckii]KAI7626139.1 hypothetical protein KC346_g1416 [Hortaea werneckii]KAI7636032.1 hypothetical protein KC343_g1483 [Hortaea werneckii]KAI7670934.1 hypothetical protein KC319_g5730 [Hortaea werneckii]
MIQCANMGNGVLWNDPKTPENPHRHLIEAELQRRGWLLQGVKLLTILPFMVFWLVGVLSYARSSRSRLWSLGGALATFLVLIGLDSALMWALTGEIHTGFWKELAIWSHLGLGAGCRLSKTSMAKRLVPPRSQEEEPSSSEDPITSLEASNTDVAKDEEARLPEEAKTEAKALKKESPPTFHLPTAWHAASMIWMAAVLVSLVVTHDLPLLSSTINCPLSGSNKFDFAVDAIFSIGSLGIYAYLAYDYPKRTTHLLREGAVGLLFAISSFATLRMTSSIDTWQSWTIDGLLAFLGFNFGLFAGYRSRLGPSL